MELLDGMCFLFEKQTLDLRYDGVLLGLESGCFVCMGVWVEAYEILWAGDLLETCPADMEVSGWSGVFEEARMRSVDTPKSHELWFTHYGLATLSNES